MKIAYCLKTFPKTSESFIVNEIIELLKKGHDVEIFSMREPVKEVMHIEVKVYNLLRRTHYFTPPHFFEENFIKLLKYFLRGVVQDLYNLKISKNGLKQNLKLAYFATIIEKRNIELIHAHFANMGVVARKLGKMLGLPYTVTAHAFDIYKNPNKDELRKVMNDAKLVVTISEYNKNYLSSEIGISNTIEMIRCGVDLNKFKPPQKIRANDRIRMLTVARLVEKKGIEYLIRSITRVIKEVPKCELTIIGSGPLYDNLQQLVHDLDVERYVQLKGDVSDSELVRYYEDADIFVLPCTVLQDGDRDGVPVAIMEAMAMELPVISTTVSGIPELVEDGVSGLLLPPYDEKAIAEAILELGKDGALRVAMGKEGRKIIEREFNIKFEAEKLINAFVNVAKHR